MKTVILCGGRGTRIRDVADNIPKPMIPVGGLPILWHLMKYYAHWGHHEFVLCLGYKAEVIKDFFLNYKTRTSDFTLTLGESQEIQFHTKNQEFDWRVTLVDTGLEAMTGARIRKVEKYLDGDENFFLTYGDGLSNVDLGKLMAFHQSHGKIMTLSGVHPTGRFGEIISDAEGQVVEFNEKPSVSGGRVSGGFFVCRRKIFQYLDSREDLVFESEPMGRLAKDRQLGLYEHNGFWQPMDTYRDYVALNALVSRGNAPWMLWK